MTRFVSVCAAVGLLASAGAAQAEETGMLPNGAHITFERIRINKDGQTPAVEVTDPEVLRRYLNLAHCTCSQAGAGNEQEINYELRLSFDTGTSQPGNVFVGTQCADDLIRPQQCRQINTIADIDLMALRPENLQFTLFDVVNGTDTMSACRQTEDDAFLWILVDSNADGTPDYTVNQAVGEKGEITGVDTRPPPLPTDIEASSAESSIVIEFTRPESRFDDIDRYQALCAKTDGSPAFESTTLTPAFQTVRSLCDLAQDVELTQSDITGGDEDSAVDVTTLPTGLAQLDPAFLCGSITGGASAGGITIDGLENGEAYTVVLLAIDKYGNFAGTFLSQTITPQPATDFWEDLHDRGSDVEGGFCLIAETYGDGNPLTSTLRAFRDDTLAKTAFGRWLIDAYYASLGQLGAVVQHSLVLRIVAGIVLAPLVAIALAWHVLTLPGLLALIALVVMWKRRRRWLAAAIAFLIPSVASAQGPTPYWDDEVQATDAEEEGLVKWHVGVRIGPYTPGIDEQLGMEPGPYEQMFGGKQWTPMIDVDRILWRRFGQLGIGGTIGYMQKTAKAWEDGSDPADPMRPRSEGDENTFRLLPLAISGVYRFTWLDDEYGIPIVPYARVGLAYYLWWIRTNGDTSEVCWDGTRTPDCDSDKAIGGSFGVVGSVGIAIRAERIDPSAATSMRASGIQHAGFYAEWSMGKVDGFRPETKLSVGDSTWFVGADFEF